MTTTTDAIDPDKLKQLEEKFDPEMRFRPTLPPASQIVTALLIALSLFHYYTAGFGLLRETTHRGVHMAFVLGLIFVVFARRRPHATDPPLRSSWAAPGGVPLVDWLQGIAIAGASLYIPYVFDDLAFRVGNPLLADVVMGSIMIVVLLEATRRSMGWPLPLIAIVFIVYALAGPVFPGLLKHAGASWSQLVNHQYLTSQGVYGIAVGVVATYVFHFVLFGVLATRIGLGQLFLDIASMVAGRYAGGPAKVSVFGSAMFGMLSGSSVANAVTVGSLTIPAMIRVGYPRHFAAGVEAAASTGGQITPPIMGAAAFLMVEFLALPYQTIILAAIVPAFMHFYGVFMQVHFEAKRRGLTPLARIVAWATVGVDPAVMGTGPIPASRKALEKAGWRADDLDLVEANEAFAAQACAVNQDLGWNTAKVNVNGGAIALGHPLGASGTRLVITILNELRRRNKNVGLVSLCIGGGQGQAAVLEVN